MCIRDRIETDLKRRDFTINAMAVNVRTGELADPFHGQVDTCLLYTSDAADERSSVDLGGRRIIKKKTTRNNQSTHVNLTEITNSNTCTLTKTNMTTTQHTL